MRVRPLTFFVRFLVMVLVLVLSSTVTSAQEADPNPPGLEPVAQEAWSEAHVRRILQAFANGGQAHEKQVAKWAVLPPERAVREMLHFKPANYQLSHQGVNYPPVRYCRSLERMMDFWSSDRPDNPMRVANRPWYGTLEQDQPIASYAHLYFAWTRLMHTPGCNGFLHKTALYLTNYHAAISVENTQPTLMRRYYDDTVNALVSGADFVQLMTMAASHAALARAYGHMGNYFDAADEFQGNDDFAREYFQLLFGIQGTTEDPVYHETVTIEHNAWLLTGMNLDAVPYAWGSEFVLDWLVAPINFTNHIDRAGRVILNQSAHYDARLGSSSCLEILRTDICGRNASEKLEALGPVAAAHPESLAATPLKFVRFFGNDRIGPEEAADLQAAWVNANFDVLAFLRAYAISTRFHAPSTVKLRNAFDRNLLIHNANQLSTDQFDAELFFEGPLLRTFEQGALVFSPSRDVFGGQTGFDVANDRFAFKNAWDANVNDPEYLGRPSAYYQPSPEEGFVEWRRDWGAVIPRNGAGEHQVSEVTDWLWNRFIGDGGHHLDRLARAQLHAMLATGYDFGVLLDQQNPDRIYTTQDLAEGDAALALEELGLMTIDLSGLEGNERIGLAVNFITALPWTFALEVTP